jgi:hypothetical protein
MKTGNSVCHSYSNKLFYYLFLNRFKQLNKGRELYDKVGLNTVKYKIKYVDVTPFYTKFTIYYNETAIMLEEYV